ncbi:MAG: phage tail sheath protein [Lachnospiraceae bacterium]|nr:phage tail sheath protein [Lachnospiraceae bacterium]
MAGTFILGETKVRPGSYFNIQKKEKNTQADVINGVTAVLFKADFGPLGTCVELNIEGGDSYESLFGTSLTTDAIREAISGGAKTIIACRVGKGGTQAEVSLSDTDDAEAMKISALFPGDKTFTVSIREKLTDATVKECIIYSGTAEFEKLEFAAGAGEVSALVAAFANSKRFTAQATEGQEQAVLQNVTQSAFTAGTNPTSTVDDYSDAFVQVEPYVFNTICVDTEDTAVHLLLAEFLDRIFDAGSLAQAVVAEKHTVELETRQAHAAAFDDEKMNYVLNAHVMSQAGELDGYQTAARIAGMIGACECNASLTHTVVNGFTEILERLTNMQIVVAEKKGCLVLTHNSNKQVWIDSAINTLITPADNQDEGWKKIRRVKTRFELIRRMSVVTEALIGKVDNDGNGRSTVISQVQAVGDAMVEESKLTSCKVTESAQYTADVDSAWFDIDVVDKDSMEHIYLTFKFQFSTLSAV